MSNQPKMLVSDEILTEKSTQTLTIVADAEKEAKKANW
jgi:hypothetical protein